MRIVSLCVLFTVWALCWLSSAVALDVKPPKPIEIFRLPRILMAGSDLAFQIRIRGAQDTDRRVFAMLCLDGGPCSTEPLQHERWSQLPIEGSASPKLWAPKPMLQIAAGTYSFVAGIGPDEGVRAFERLSVTVQGF